jgi:hypothetical protein
MTYMKSVRKLQMYVLLHSAVNLASSLVKVYVHLVAVLGLTLARIADSGSHRICGVGGYMYDAEGP